MKKLDDFRPGETGHETSETGEQMETEGIAEEIQIEKRAESSENLDSQIEAALLARDGHIRMQRSLIERVLEGIQGKAEGVQDWVREKLEAAGEAVYLPNLKKKAILLGTGLALLIPAVGAGSVEAMEISPLARKTKQEMMGMGKVGGKQEARQEETTPVFQFQGGGLEILKQNFPRIEDAQGYRLAISRFSQVVGQFPTGAGDSLIISAPGMEEAKSIQDQLARINIAARKKGEQYEVRILHGRPAEAVDTSQEEELESQQTRRSSSPVFVQVLRSMAQKS